MTEKMKRLVHNMTIGAGIGVVISILGTVIFHMWKMQEDISVPVILLLVFIGFAAGFFHDFKYSKWVERKGKKS